MTKIFAHLMVAVKVQKYLFSSLLTLLPPFLLSLFVVSSIGITSSIAIAQEQANRPKIGLALSGGGARGAAHVGVIQVLEELHIPIDYIAGTSMGAVVGGLYASGMTSDEIARQLELIDWDSIFEDKPTRPERTQRRKDDDRTYLFDGRIGVSESGLNFARAKVIGQKFDLILKSLTLPVIGITNFDSLPIPYRAVAMDITTGDEIVLSEGDLSLAMHASMAIPGAFAPVELNGKLLVDGGAANNLPISVARDMGADIVIAIDISTPLLNRDELKGVLTIINQLTGLLTRRNTEAQIKTLTKKDVLIVPDLGTISTMDFEYVVKAVDKGKYAAQSQQQQLAQLSIDQTSYLDHVAKQKSDNKQHTDTVIHFVRFENDSKIDEQVLRSHFGIEAGQQVDLDKIELGITNIFSLDLFETVTYDLVAEQGNTGIIVKAKQKSWGTDYLQGGFELASDFSGGDSAFNIGLAYTHQPINRLNGEWRTAIQLGEEPAVLTEIYQPLDTRSRFFAHGILSWGRRDVKLFNNSLDRAEVEYDLTEKQLQLAVGRNFGTWGDVRIGVARITGDADVSIGGPSFSNTDFEDGYIYTRARIDTLDNLDFPRFGYLSTIEWLGSSDTLGADDDYDQVNLYLAHARNWGKDSIIASIDYGSTVSGDAPIHGRYQLGGFMNLSGISVNELSGQNFGLMSFVYQRRLFESRFLSTYAGGAIQAGNVWEDKSDISTNDLIASGTLFVGTDTPVGPIYLGFGHAEGGDNAGYLFLGQPFFK
jgi:NTE family protein